MYQLIIEANWNIFVEKLNIPIGTVDKKKTIEIQQDAILVDIFVNELQKFVDKYKGGNIIYTYMFMFVLEQVLLQTMQEIPNISVNAIQQIKEVSQTQTKEVPQKIVVKQIDKVIFLYLISLYIFFEICVIILKSV